MKVISTRARGLAQRSHYLLLSAVFTFGCGAAPEDSEDVADAASIDGEELAATAEDGLADAFALFAQTFSNGSASSLYTLGLGYHPGLSTEKLAGPEGLTASGQAVLNLNTGQVTATLNNVPESGNFELWLVKNVAGGTMAPEPSDRSLKVGKFSSQGASRTLDVSIGFDVMFDLDLVVVTRAGKKPHESRIVVGDRSLFEKRIFRFRQKQTLEPVTGALANNIETSDPLVARGAQLFFNETFGGNGRTCGTCHRAEHNLTIDPAFIAQLPQSDPLFVAENNPALAQLEDPQLLRSRALIRENVDGFDDPTHKFVMRSVPHTFSLNLTNGFAAGVFTGAPPDDRLGWAGDGGPGRGVLHDFSFGAIVQHFTKNLKRRPGVDFRIPTQEELDALEAFQLFTGRQKPVNFGNSLPSDARAASGRELFVSTGCLTCHTDIFGTVPNSLNLDTGVRNLTPQLPVDDGFGSPGDATFNVPPLAEAADTPPFFHNNAVDTIEEAVAFYFSPTFRATPNAEFFITRDLSTDQQGDVAAFLRVVNSAFNIDQVAKRVKYVQSVRSAGNTELLAIAIADARDARVVLADKQLNSNAQKLLNSAEVALKNAVGDKDKDRPASMAKVLTLLDKARLQLLPPFEG